MADITANPQQQQPPDASQSPSLPHHFPAAPISGTTLFEAEVKRRDALWDHGRGNLTTGCREIDEAVLAGGGFERGCVVGVSCEEEDVGLAAGVQTLVRCLLKGARGRGRRRPRAMVVTTMGVAPLVGVLRDVAVAQIAEMGSEGKGLLKDCLERVAVSRVFDVPGLWEVLGELDRLPPSQELGEEEEEEVPSSRQDGGDASREDRLSSMLHGDANDELRETAIDGRLLQDEKAATAAEPPSSPLSDPPSSLPDELPWGTADTVEQEAASPTRTPPGMRQEIQDSEEEEEGFSSPLELTRVSPVTLPVKTDLHTTEDVEASPEITSQKEQKDSDQQEELPVKSHETVLADESSPGVALDEPDHPLRSPTEPTDAAQDAKPAADQSTEERESTHPDIILITHMSTLLSSLFHQREKATAHSMLQLLASHLRYLSRSPEYGGPLIMILNSTTSSPDTANTAAPDQDGDGPLPRPAPAANGRPLDATLRSIFNPPPLPSSGLGAVYRYDAPHARRNKPSFGLVFSQMLDLHLLCTRIPKTRADAEALYAPAPPDGTARKKVGYAWAVEVLLDEIGVWEGRAKVVGGTPRHSREQRWGAVELRRDARGGLRVVGAFQKADGRPEEVVLAAGFGGRRV